MSALVVKELRQLLPIVWLWLAVIALGVATLAATERIDEETFASWCEGICERGTDPFVAAFSVLFAIVTAYSLFPREHDERTIDFLRALPLSRRAVFAAKIIAGWLVLAGITLLAYAVDAALLATNPESLGGRFQGQVWWTLLWRDAVFAFIILAHGVVLSWFRVVGLVLYALYVLTLLLVESRSGSAGLLSVFAVLSNEYEGQRLLVDARAILVHVGVACALLVIGERLWSRTEPAGRRAGRGGGALAVLASALAFFALTALALWRVGAATGSVPDAELEVVATEHYRFAYRPRDAETVGYLLDHADADLAALGERLGVETLPFVRVDLAAASEHAAGLAKWKKIRIDLSSFTADRSQRRVLAHEAVHVLQAVESDRALARRFRETRFFVEGMAQYLSFEVVPEPVRRAANHALAAVARARQDIRFADLVDDAGFSARFDPELYYSLGDLWTVALVRTCGERVLGDFLRAVGREGAPEDLGGERFWRDTFAAIDCSFDAVDAAWDAAMRAALEAVDLARFPRFEDIVVGRAPGEDVIRLEARLAPAAESAAAEEVGVVPPERVVARISDADRIGAGVDPVLRGTLERDGTGALRAVFSVPARLAPRGRFRYQLGYQPSVAPPATPVAEAGAVESRVYYEDWREGAVGR